MRSRGRRCAGFSIRYLAKTEASIEWSGASALSAQGSSADGSANRPYRAPRRDWKSPDSVRILVLSPCRSGLIPPGRDLHPRAPRRSRPVAGLFEAGLGRQGSLDIHSGLTEASHNATAGRTKRFCNSPIHRSSVFVLFKNAVDPVHVDQSSDIPIAARKPRMPWLKPVRTVLVGAGPSFCRSHSPSAENSNVSSSERRYQ